MLVQDQPLETRMPRLWSVGTALASVLAVATIATLSAARPASADESRTPGAGNVLPSRDPLKSGFVPTLKLTGTPVLAWQVRHMPKPDPAGRSVWPDVSDPMADAGHVYYGDGDALYAVEAKTGAVAWSYEHGERIYAPIATDGERVFFPSNQGVTAVNCTDGHLAWQRPIEKGAGHGGCAVWIPSDTIFCGGNDGFVYAMDRRTGAVKWKSDIIADAPPDQPNFPGKTARFGEIIVRPSGISTDGKLVYQSIFDQSRLVAIDCKTGQRRWSFQTGGWILGNAAVGDRHIFVGSQDDRLYCVDKETGRMVWQFATKSRIECGPAVAGSNVFVCSCDGSIYCLTSDTGKQVWSYATQPENRQTRAIYSNPIVTEDAVCFAAGEGQVYAIERATGQLKWKFRPSPGSELYSSAGTDGQHIFLSTRPGHDAGEASVIAIKFQ